MKQQNGGKGQIDWEGILSWLDTKDGQRAAYEVVREVLLQMQVNDDLYFQIGRTRDRSSVLLLAKATGCLPVTVGFSGFYDIEDAVVKFLTECRE